MDLVGGLNSHYWHSRSSAAIYQMSWIQTKSSAPCTQRNLELARRSYLALTTN